MLGLLLAVLALSVVGGFRALLRPPALAPLQQARAHRVSVVGNLREQGRLRTDVLENVRVTDYGKPLREQDVVADPLAQFGLWFSEAEVAGLRMPEAAALATASPGGAP